MKNLYLQLFTTFMKIGAFTFGGGWAMIPLIEREVVDRHRWISREEFLDELAVAQSLPGILAVNVAVLVGNKLRGVKGSLWAATGTILPSFVMILMIAMFFTNIYDNEAVASIFKGIRPAVVALIIVPVLSTAKSAKLNRYTFVIPIVVALAIWMCGVSPIYCIIAGAVGGYLYYVVSQHRTKGGDA
ncbi:MAG: chromate transporter [Bacteroidaceae bacterium]|nr:chromate transporter [Bacteroidaceae bacterium]